MKRIQNIISRITLALMGEGRGMGLLFMAIVMMAMNPTKVRAEIITSNTTISSDKVYDVLDIQSGTVIIESGVTVTLNSPYSKTLGKLINYGTIVGDIMIINGGVLANHGSVTGTIQNYGCTFYNTGTYGKLIYAGVTQCAHSNRTEMGMVSATCTTPAGIQSKCDECGYIKNDGVLPALGHAFDAVHTHAAVAATCTTDGSIAYRECTRCHHYFDMEGTEVKNLVVAAHHTPDANGFCTVCEKAEAKMDTRSENGNVLPYYNNWKYATSISLYLGSEINVTGTIKDIAYQVQNAVSFSPTEVKIYLAMTDLTELSSSTTFDASDFTLVYSGSPTLGTATGWEALTLDTPFKYDKTRNLLVAVCRKSNSCKANLRYYWSRLGNRSVLWRSDDDETYGSLSVLSQTSSTGNGLPDIRMNMVESTESVATYALTDGTTYAGQTMEVGIFTYQRTFGDTNWTTWYEPFQLTLTDEICDKYDFARISNVRQFDNDDNGVAERTVVECLLQSTGTLSANYPYLVRARSDADKAMELSLQNVTLNKPDENSIYCQSLDTKYTFTGTYTGKGDGTTASADYALADGADGWKHYNALAPQRHYLTISSLDGNSLPSAPQLIEYNVIGYECGAHAYTDYGKDLSTGLYSSICHNGGCCHEVRLLKDFAPDAVGAAKDLELIAQPDGTMSTSEAIALTDANQFKDEKVTFRTNAAPTYTRTGIKNQWGTVVVPFAVTNGEDYDLYEVTSVDDDELCLQKVTGTLPAGTPVLVRMSASAKNAETERYDLTMTACSNTVKVTGSLTATPKNGLTLTGAYSRTVLASAEQQTAEPGYIISNNAFWNIATLRSDYGATEVYIGAFRAYLAGSLSNGASQLRIGNATDEEIETALEVLEALTSGDALEAYDLNGRRQDDLQPGVNIIKRGDKSVKVILK